jgi:hypothetical protein
LRLGLDVIADSCNPVELTRREWEQVGKDNAAGYVNIEVICSNQAEHRRRVESRTADTPRLRLPGWCDVECREYHAWSADRIVIDTTDRSSDESFAALMAALSKMLKTL